MAEFRQTMQILVNALRKRVLANNSAPALCGITFMLLTLPSLYYKHIKKVWNLARDIRHHFMLINPIYLIDYHYF